MKIAIVGSGVVSIPPRRGGAIELIIYELSKAMGKKHDVTVYDLKEGHNKERESISGAVYRRMTTPKFNNTYLMRFSELIFGLRALSAVRQSKPDVVHGHTVFSSLPFAMFKFLFPGKFVYTCHNPAWSTTTNSIANKIILFVEGFIMRKSDFVTTVSKDMMKNICEKTKTAPGRICVVYNFVDLEKFKPLGRRWRKYRNIRGPMVIFVGKLIENKGVASLLEGAKHVIGSVQDTKFVLVGPVSFEHQSRNKWERMADDLGIGQNVIFTGALMDDELPYAYSSADLFCFPTKKESFGMVIIEAMACGLPVITTDLNVTREVAGDAAIFVDTSPVHIADAIVRLLGNKRLMKKMSRISVQRSRRFEKNRVLDQYGDVYNRVTG